MVKKRQCASAWCISFWSIILSFVYCVTLNRNHIRRNWNKSLMTQLTAQTKRSVMRILSVLPSSLLDRHNLWLAISSLCSRAWVSSSGWMFFRVDGNDKGLSHLAQWINWVLGRALYVCDDDFMMIDGPLGPVGLTLNNSNFFSLEADKLQVQESWWMTFKSSPVTSRTVRDAWSIAWSSQFTVWWPIKCAHDAVLIGSQSAITKREELCTPGSRYSSKLNAFTRAIRQLKSRVSCLMRAKENPFSFQSIVAFPSHFPSSSKFSRPIEATPNMGKSLKLWRKL